MRGRILIVDDDRAVRESLARALHESGYDVTTAADGHEALEQLIAGKLRPDVIVLDVLMPKINGWEFRVAQLESPDLVDIPVVLLSGSESRTVRLWDLVGVTERLAKPIPVSRLISSIERVTAR